MGIGTSIFFIAVGAILAFAVEVTDTSGINLHTVGWILMIVGVLGALLSMAFWGRNRPLTLRQHVLAAVCARHGMGRRSLCKWER
jgi:hypothetical protein